MNVRQVSRQSYSGHTGVTVGAVLMLVLMTACRDPERGQALERPARYGGAEVVADTLGMAERLRIRRGVYVPVYSHIYTQDGSREFNLTATLSIRNTDRAAALVVTAVRYYDSAGQLVREYVAAPLRLGPLASVPFVVEERDLTGGVGANFVVEWGAEQPVSAPIIEAVMISTASQQGISFVSRGEVIWSDTLRRAVGPTSR